jgi:predicted DsbA family dithiol-disulfide isomerase
LLVFSSLEKLKESHGVTVAWRSFELRPKDAPPPPPEYLAKVKASRPRLYAMAKEQYGLDLNPGPFGIDSRPALVGAKYAEAQDVGDAYHETIFKAYWLEGRNIEDRAVLTDVATAIGLDADAFLAALETETYQAAMLSDVAQAQAYGLHAVPALIFVDKYLVSGAQPYEVLCEVVERIESGNIN